jgi:hypothetical protein
LSLGVHRPKVAGQGRIGSRQGQSLDHVLVPDKLGRIGEDGAGRMISSEVTRKTV